jgi:lipoprotein-anchoring transpeptidase ErfK/SrfK
LLRIHGTPSRGSVGRAVSNGCIRMLNEDVIDLYERVHIGAPVIAINKRGEAARFSEPVVSGKLAVR